MTPTRRARRSARQATSASAACLGIRGCLCLCEWRLSGNDIGVVPQQIAQVIIQIGQVSVRGFLTACLAHHFVRCGNAWTSLPVLISIRRFDFAAATTNIAAAVASSAARFAVNPSGNHCRGSCEGRRRRAFDLFVRCRCQQEDGHPAFRKQVSRRETCCRSRHSLHHQRAGPKRVLQLVALADIAAFVAALVERREQVFGKRLSPIGHAETKAVCGDRRRLHVQGDSARL